MRLACWVVTRKLAGLPPDRALPVWAVRHIERCERCAMEEAAYAKLSAALKTEDPAEKTCRLSWDNLRSALETRPTETLVPRRHSAWAVIGASALVITAVASLWLRPVNRDTPNQPQVVREAERKAAPTPKEAPMIAEQPSTPDQPETDAVAPDEQAARWTSAVSQPPVVRHGIHRRHPVVSRVRRNIAANRHRRMSVPDANVIADAAAAQPKTPSVTKDRPTDTPELAIVAPSEHVIDVVGAGSLGEGEEVGTIQQVSYREGNSVRL